MPELDTKIQAEYFALKGAVDLDTMLDASPDSLLNHPLFLEIVAMGERVLPVILTDLRDNEFSWVPFLALQKITGLYVPPSLQAKDMQNVSREESLAAWLEWGRDWRYTEKDQ